MGFFRTIPLQCQGEDENNKNKATWFSKKGEGFEP